jgi:hypothetical protein
MFPFCAPDWLAAASLSEFCALEVGGLSEVVVGSVESVEVVPPDGSPAVVTITFRVSFPPVPGSAFAPPAASFGGASVPTRITLDGPRVELAETGVPVSSVDVVVVDVSPVVGAARPVVATVVVPFGWASAKAAGAESNRAMVTAEIATPPTPARVVQLSED